MSVFFFHTLVCVPVSHSRLLLLLLLLPPRSPASLNQPSKANWRAKHSFQYNLLCDRSFEALKKLGWAKSGGGVVRSHALIEKGGTVKDVQSPVSSKDSVGLAVEAL